MVHHGHAALGTLEHLAAVLALGNGLIAPAVEQKDGLLFRFQIAADGIFQRKADFPGIARCQFCPHIHDLHAGQRIAAVTLGQPHQLGTSVLRSVETLGAGGGTGQKQQGTVFGGTLPGDFVGRVARCGFRPVGVLLLFVNDDKADVFQRRKHSAAGADHDICAAVLDHLPLQQALGVVERGVLHRHPAAKLPF